MRMKKIDFQIDWQARSDPLPPSGLLARGGAARTLLARCARLESERKARLRGVFDRELMIVFGESADLPWTNGGIYLGASLDFPGIYWPTVQAALPREELLAHAFLRADSPLKPPLAILPDPPEVILIRDPRPLPEDGTIPARILEGKNADSSP